jgi:hypothetical protein
MRVNQNQTRMTTCGRVTTTWGRETTWGRTTTSWTRRPYTTWGR